MTDWYLSIGIDFWKSPAEWTAALLLAVGLMYQLRERRIKALRMRIIRAARVDVYGNDSVELVISNTGSVGLGIHNYGFRGWSGIGIDQKNFSTIYGGEIFHPEREPLHLAFYDGVVGRNIQISDQDVFFYFVETGTKVFRYYPNGFIRSHLRRFGSVFKK